VLRIQTDTHATQMHKGEFKGVGNWPDYKPGGRPRSATVVIRKRDGGVIGA
jgi:secreted PhoX family phosphatase